jgi:hypothetical protein
MTAYHPANLPAGNNFNDELKYHEYLFQIIHPTSSVVLILIAYFIAVLLSFINNVSARNILPKSTFSIKDFEKQ